MESEDLEGQVYASLRVSLNDGWVTVTLDRLNRVCDSVTPLVPPHPEIVVRERRGTWH